MKAASYEKAIAWIVREGRPGKIPRDIPNVAGWRVVNMTAALFDKPVIEVAHDVVYFAKAIDAEHQP